MTSSKQVRSNLIITLFSTVPKKEPRAPKQSFDKELRILCWGQCKKIPEGKQKPALKTSFPNPSARDLRGEQGRKKRMMAQSCHLSSGTGLQPPHHPSPSAVSVLFSKMEYSQLERGEHRHPLEQLSSWTLIKTDLGILNYLWLVNDTAESLPVREL